MSGIQVPVDETPLLGIVNLLRSTGCHKKAYRITLGWISHWLQWIDQRFIRSSRKGGTCCYMMLYSSSPSHMNIFYCHASSWSSILRIAVNLLSAQGWMSQWRENLLILSLFYFFVLLLCNSYLLGTGLLWLVFIRSKILSWERALQSVQVLILLL